MPSQSEKHAADASSDEREIPVEVVVMMGGPMVGVSGGDTHALRFVAGYERRWPGTTRLIAPPGVADHVPKAVRSQMLTLRTPFDKWIRKIFVYAIVVGFRTVIASIVMPRSRTVVASSHFLNDVIPCVVARRRGRSQVVVFIYHLVNDMDRATSLRSIVSGVAESLSLSLLRRYAGVVFVDNDEVARSLEARGFAKERIVMTENAFDPLVPLPPRVESDPPLLSFCGRFVEEKGIWDVLELGRLLAAAAPRARIEMIGDGPLFDQFANRLKETKLDNIVMRGFVSEADKWSLLRSSNLFIAPSREEGWGIAVGEALTAGVPVVAYDLPAYRYLGDAIDRVPTADTERFIRKVSALVSDPEQLAALSAGLAAKGAGLPLWDDILSAEFAIVREGLVDS